MPDLWGVAAILSKLLLYAGVTGATGLVMIRLTFADLVRPLARAMRRQAQALAGLALGAAALGFMLRGAALTGGAGGMTDPEMLGLLWQTPVGDALALRVAGAAVMIAGLCLPRAGQWVALAGGLLALWSFTRIGHIPELDQNGLRLLLLLHLLGIAFWIGALGPLRALALRGADLSRAAELGHRFGRAAAVIVPVLIMAGAVMAWLLLGDLRALVATGYGQALLKLALVGAVLGLAAANKLRFVPAMQAGDGRAARHLARSIEVETIVMVLVLAATATLTSVMTLPN
ncbi:copper resistance D family protein [Actibacterium ureilyticum]|uniref:copper resistance D family protein n=1 Tax=Actibacterium ureilyticum TaxID=1590614 RepID=UPI000BAAB9D6|nr:CopD family protein [Actibacterium ureilyticum]